MKSILYFLLLALIGTTGCQSVAEPNRQQAQLPTPGESVEEPPYYQLVLIWVKDPAKFHRYAELVTPVVAKYGGAPDLILEPQSIYAESMEQPHIVNLVHYRSKKAYREFESDPAFLAIKHLRDESIEMKAFEGHADLMDMSHPSDTGHLYNVEIAGFTGGDPAPYARYESEGEPAMQKFGYHVDARISLPKGQGYDLVKISSWKNAQGHKDFESHPMHHTIEAELYPTAVDKMIWITARLHPMVTQASG